MPFRVNACQFALTFAQCAVEADAALASLLASPLADKLDCAVVAQEEHKDGRPHLHLALRFKTPLNVRDAKFFDFLCPGHHANVQGCRKWLDWLRYLWKTNGKKASHGIDVDSVLEASAKKKNTRSDAVYDAIAAGTPLIDVVKQHKGYALLHLPAMQRMKTFLEEEKKVSEMPTFRPFEARLILRPHGPDACIYYLRVGLPRAHNETGWWLCGPTGVGKTSHILKPIMDRCAHFELPFNNDWVGYDDRSVQLLWCDEFKGNVPIQTINRLCDATPMRLNIKQAGSSLYKTKNVPLIVASNYMIKDAWKNAGDGVVAAVARRFDFIWVADFDYELELVDVADIETDSAESDEEE